MPLFFCVLLFRKSGSAELFQTQKIETADSRFAVALARASVPPNDGAVALAATEGDTLDELIPIAELARFGAVATELDERLNAF